MKDVLKYLLFSLLTCFAFSPLFATHVVGGEVYYNYLGNDNYYVHLSLYVDCENGNPGAILADTTGTIAVFEGLTNELKKFREVRRSTPIRLNKQQYNCVQPPLGVCVDLYTFDTVFALKPNAYGYYIAFQRCCRNESILNIVNPLRTGSTYSAFIPPIQEYGSNSNPRFKQRPPNYLCVNEQFSFDHSATDVDNDSLIYRICAPKNMQSIDPPKPHIPSSPPYLNVIWKSGFSDSLPLPVAKSFAIKDDGNLVFMPKSLGQYVFAVCVDEYRDDKFLSTSWRDYQFNVMPCKFDVRASFKMPNILCSGDVLFKSESTGAKNITWIIDLDDGSSFNSEKETITLPFNMPGSYKAQLIASNGNCADTLVKKFNVLPKNDFNNFNLEVCKGDTIVLMERDFYGLEAFWSGSDTLINVYDTLKGFSGNDNAFFVHRGDYDGCAFIDTYFVRVFVNEPLIDIDTFEHCLGQVFSFDLINHTVYDDYKWVYNNESNTKDGFRFLVPFGASDSLKLEMMQKGCADKVYFDLAAVGSGEIAFVEVNIITPNSDGLNDCFSPIVKGGDFACGSYSMEIFNRWGGTVYKTIADNKLPCWNGTNYKGGGRVQPGTYFYFIEVDGFKKYGTVTVVY